MKEYVLVFNIISNTNDFNSFLQSTQTNAFTFVKCECKWIIKFQIVYRSRQSLQWRLVPNIWWNPLPPLLPSPPNNPPENEKLSYQIIFIFNFLGSKSNQIFGYIQFSWFTKLQQSNQKLFNVQLCWFTMLQQSYKILYNALLSWFTKINQLFKTKLNSLPFWFWAIDH